MANTKMNVKQVKPKKENVKTKIIVGRSGYWMFLEKSRKPKRVFIINLQFKFGKSVTKNRRNSVVQRSSKK